MKGYVVRRAIALLAAGLLAACGVDKDTETTYGKFNVALTDASVDGVAEVWVIITAVTIEAQDGAPTTYPLNPPRAINLMELSNGQLETLLQDTTIVASLYNGVKLDVVAKIDGVFDSYVVDSEGAQYELAVEQGSTVVFRPFAMVMNLETGLIVEWNLRTGLTGPNPATIQGTDIQVLAYGLLPSLRAVNWLNHGTIAGTVDSALISDPSCTSDPNSGAGNVVYIYEGLDVVPDDVDQVSPNPLTTAEVRFNDYSYSAPYLEPGDYTVAFTCQGRDDQVPAGPEDGNDPIKFTPGINVRVLPPEEIEGESVPQTVEVNFTAA